MAKIFIVEDDQMLAEVYQTRIQLAGYKCPVAYDGLSGFALIREVQPDLVLLNLMLPQLSGDEVLAQMRKHDWGKDTKVIVLTNISEAEAPDDLRELVGKNYMVTAGAPSNQLDRVVADTPTNEEPRA